MYLARTQPDISTQAMVRLWHNFLLLNIFPLTAVTSHILNIELQFLKPILLVHEYFCIHFLTHLLYIHNSNWNKNLDSQYFGMMMIGKGTDHQSGHHRLNLLMLRDKRDQARQTYCLAFVRTVFTMYLDLIQPSFKNCNWFLNSIFKVFVCTAVFTILQKSIVWDSPSVYDTICHDHKFIWTFVVFWNEVQLIHSLQIYVEQFIWNQPLLDLAVV